MITIAEQDWHVMQLLVAWQAGVIKRRRVATTTGLSETDVQHRLERVLWTVAPYSNPFDDEEIQ